ncbi:serine protease gd-like isoform X2 [Diabrotica virgifera virgifera]|uniref:Serine protease gd-like isoform X2 n=1 Tax=Diabrotica virgifera virgifera TaxID=50390 RepID=A0A6P7EYV8_DIAVI|nr:serine protease gd-like isoform X2 [Diabrotica virgifera virgifera]
MKYKYEFAFLLIWLPAILSKIRIPPVPCPDMFKYYKNHQGAIYGEARIPYDQATSLVFSVNASYGGYPTQTKLRLERKTDLHELNDGTSEVIYNIYFPSNAVIPKITGLTFNDKIYCSGPKEPLATFGKITDVWSQDSFQFSRQKYGFYKPETKPDTSEDDIPVKNPNQKLPATPRVPTQRVPTLPVQTQRVPTPASPKTTRKPPQIPSRQHEVPSVVDPTENDPYYVNDELLDSVFTKQPSKSPSFNSNFKCGVASVPIVYARIIGATVTDIGQYPWLVAFFRTRGSEYDYTCSATLISEKHVLTAARCVQNYKFQAVKTDDILLVMGTNDLENWNSNGAVTRKARRVDVHPFFMKNPKSAHGDIAIILMESPVQFSSELSPICLWKGNTDLYPLTNRTGVIAAFGQDENSPEEGLTHVLRAKKADMPIVDQTECLLSRVGFEGVASERTFCTSGEKLTGPCTGDTGAGFFISIDGAYNLRGIASVIPSKNGRCDLSSGYSVFCDVAKFLEWIKSRMT